MTRKSYPSIQAQDCDTIRLCRQAFGDTCGVQVLSVHGRTLRWIRRIAPWQPDSYTGENYSSTSNT